MKIQPERRGEVSRDRQNDSPALDEPKYVTYRLQGTNWKQVCTSPFSSLCHFCHTYPLSFTWNFLSSENKTISREYGQNHSRGTSLVAQWLRIRLPMQGTRVRALVREDPTCHGATKPMCHNFWACVPRARAQQQEKPLQWEAHALQWRAAPARRN